MILTVSSFPFLLLLLLLFHSFHCTDDACQDMDENQKSIFHRDSPFSSWFALKAQRGLYAVSLYELKSGTISKSFSYIICHFSKGKNMH